jgi:hypothetical protein
MTATYYRSKSRPRSSRHEDNLVVSSFSYIPAWLAGDTVFSGNCDGKLEHQWVFEKEVKVLGIGCPMGTKVETIFNKYRGISLNVYVQAAQ